MSAARYCSALIIGATASGQGKTTVTAALARQCRDRGLRVRVFKTGPDFIDPTLLERASGNPVYQLDLWMGSEAHCRDLLYRAAGEADLILIEGVMGLFDGVRSSADLSALFGIPALAVIDGSAMAQTFGAIAYGLANYRQDVRFAGVIANRVASDKHFAMLAESLPPGITCFGYLRRDAEIALPQRHLGLVLADEVENVDDKIASAAKALIADVNGVENVRFDASDAGVIPRALDGVRIAVACDVAFSFLYHANIDTLQALGAEVVYFSPLHDASLPVAESVYLPGGYPELHLSALKNNVGMAEALRAHHRLNKPLLAECGGMLYLAQSLSDAKDNRADMVGLIPGHAKMQKQRANLGWHSADLPEGSLRGHTFHYSQFESPLKPSSWTAPQRQGGKAEAIFRRGRLVASYLHSYFPSNPQAVAALFAP